MAIFRDRIIELFKTLAKYEKATVCTMAFNLGGSGRASVSKTSVEFGCFVAQPMRHNEPNGNAGELMKGIVKSDGRI